MFSELFKKRFLILNILIISIFPIIIFQLFRLTIQNREMLQQYADRQHNLIIEIPPERGIIYDRNGKEFATNLKVPSIYAVPRLISQEEKSELIRKLGGILGLSQNFIEDRLSRDKAFIWLKRRTVMKEADDVLALKNPALGITYEKRRFYPHGTMLANVIGFCNIDNEGVEGMELSHNSKLMGRAGCKYTKRDAMGRELIAMEQKLIPAVDGSHLILTIDQHIQFLTDQALDEAFTKWHAKSATAVVMNPKTGEILAMSNRPTFDPNKLNESDPEVRRNRTITDIMEPGSVFKIVTVSGGLDTGSVQLTDAFDCEHGAWRVLKSRVIHDVHPYGVLDVPGILIKSSNIGTVKVALVLGEEKLYDYVKRFGFGDKTGIDFPGEVSGIFRPLNKWSGFSITSIPYGQEVAATPIQIVRAVAAIANGGYLVKPYLVKEIRDPTGVALYQHESEAPNQIISSKVAADMRAILQRVVDEGTGREAQIDGIRVGGKTGTSQKLEHGGYSHSHFIGSFLGFAPVEDPTLTMVVSIDDPHPSYYGGTVAAPVFQEVIEKALLYSGYVPDYSQVNLKVAKKPVVVEQPKKSVKKSSKKKTTKKTN